MSKRLRRCADLQKGQYKNQKAQKMKRIYSQQIVDFIEQNEEMQELYPIKKKQPKSQPFKFKEETVQSCQVDENMRNSQSSICLVCCQENFGKGKYILDCSHVLCNECLHYWQQISQNCPVCSKKSTSILSVLDGQQRISKINFAKFMPQCAKCNKNSHYHLMYFCDECNESCIHTYCQPSLLKQSKSQKWICEHCIYSNYYQNKYNQQSISQDLQQKNNDEQDSFVVPDNVVQYIHDSNSNDNNFYQDSQPTIRRQNKKQTKKNRSNARQKRREK